MLYTLFLGLSFLGQYLQTSSLSITVTNCKSNQGKVYLALYHSEKTFMKEAEALSKKILPITNGKATIKFENLAMGEYAFVFFHDENGNGKLDTNFLGIPTEGYGFSNNAKGTFGPPSYQKSKVVLKSNSHYTSVQLNY